MYFVTLQLIVLLGLAAQSLVEQRRNSEVGTVRRRDAPVRRSTARSVAQWLDDFARQSLRSAAGLPSSTSDGPNTHGTARQRYIALYVEFM